MDLSTTDLPASFTRDRRADTHFECTRVHSAPAYTVYACTFVDGDTRTSTSFEVHVRRRTTVGFEGKGSERKRVVIAPKEYLANAKEFGRHAWACSTLAAAISKGNKLTLHPTMRD